MTSLAFDGTNDNVIVADFDLFDGATEGTFALWARPDGISGNKYLALTTLLLDVLKAVIPVLYIKFNYPELVYVSSLSVFIGHVFPLWLKFKGGKGVATYVGILFSINYILGFVFIASWLIIFFISKYSSLGSILSTLLIPIFIFLNSSYENQYFFIIMFVLILYTHRENVKRLINKEESKTKIY